MEVIDKARDPGRTGFAAAGLFRAAYRHSETLCIQHILLIELHLRGIGLGSCSPIWAVCGARMFPYCSQRPDLAIPTARRSAPVYGELPNWPEYGGLRGIVTIAGMRDFIILFVHGSSPWSDWQGRGDSVPVVAESAPSGITSKPAINGHFKTGHFRAVRVTRFIPCRRAVRQ